jgi:flagellin-like hook-associated protein FlgL
MRVTTMVPDTLYNIQQSQQALSAALQQVSTGLRVNQPSDDPAASANMVLSLASSANVDQYTKNISAVTSQMQTADSALSSVVTSLNTAVTLGTSGASGILSTANKQAIATQVQGVLANVVSQANASYQGAYLFGGSETAGPPILPASTTFTSAQGTMAPPLAVTLPLTAGSVTTISDAATGKTFVFTVAAGQTIASLSTAVANAAAAGILSPGSTATINATGQLQISSNSGSAGIVASSNDPVLGAMTATPGTEVPNAYAYVGNSTVNTVPVGDSLNVASNLPGGQIFTSGANVIGSLSGLITALQSGTSTQIEAATNAVSTALAGVGEQRIPLDNSISQLNSQESYLGQETLSLTSQQTSLVGANLALSATNLSEAELTNSAVLAAAAKVLPETLLNYLQPA